MAKQLWTPWHEVVKIREDLRSGELPLAIFAADLYDVMMGTARPVYNDPREFFALTYPTYNLRELAKDVVGRLAGKNDKCVRQLELTYGGGKTHSLITLFHLVNDPGNLPNLSAVKEFTGHIGIKLPKARIAVLAFDKLDVEKGMEVRDPEGNTRWLKNPWSVMAYQIAGDKGLALLHPDDKAKERDSAPAENLLTELLAIPGKDGLSTLILIDEVLMYAREKIALDKNWRAKLVNFFQYLTQAATKVDKCAIVASLLATDPRKSDSLGKEITNELYAIFRREREEGVQPVVKEDVAEVLRRRFFDPKTLKDRDIFREHVIEALKGIKTIDEQTKKEGKAAEERYFDSYPFHPDLTDVFYSKWTQLEGFQRTRGILRIFALALRSAEKWDESPLVGADVFLCDPDKEGISEAARELTSIATTEEFEGRKQEWTGILEGELRKAKEIQSETGALKHREIEQAVFATFLHSQPIGAKALTRELMVLLGHTRPDKIELEKGLSRWTEVSWFLDEAAIGDIDVTPEGRKQLPKSWRLGSKPNLRQMHFDAKTRISDDLVKAKLIDEIPNCKSLTANASAAGAKVHKLPQHPREIEDDGEFHYAVLGPKAVSDSGKPSAEAQKFILETTTEDRPRVYKNAVVLVAPSRDGLEASKNAIRDYLGWEEVKSQLKDQEVDATRAAMLRMYIDNARKKIPEAIEQAYCIVITLSEKDEVQAFKVTGGDEPLFMRIKADSRSRIKETPVTAEALLPGGPYDLWREEEKSRRLKDLVGAFAQFPKLPKMLNPKAVLETILDGCKQGNFVLRLERPDRSVRTFWRERPDENAIKEPGLEVVLPQYAELASLTPDLLVPGALPELWSGNSIAVSQVYDYFIGGKVVKTQKKGYDEPAVLPKAGSEVIEKSIEEAVSSGRLWLVSGQASILGEEIPAGILTADAILQAPPQPIPAPSLLPAVIPEAWKEGLTTALALSVALSRKAGKPLPWGVVREAVDGALRARMLIRTEDSIGWPCDFTGAQAIKLRVPSEKEQPIPQPKPTPAPGIKVGEAEIKANQIQDLAEVVGDLLDAAVDHQLKFRLQIELSGEGSTTEKVVEAINKILKDFPEGLRLK